MGEISVAPASLDMSSSPPPNEGDLPHNPQHTNDSPKRLCMEPCATRPTKSWRQPCSQARTYRALRASARLEPCYEHSGQEDSAYEGKPNNRCQLRPRRTSCMHWAKMSTPRGACEGHRHKEIGPNKLCGHMHTETPLLLFVRTTMHHPKGLCKAPRRTLPASKGPPRT